MRTCKFETRLEFDEGDVGLPGGLQFQEKASLNPISSDRILRYGGSCAPEMQWPEEDVQYEEGANYIERTENYGPNVASTFELVVWIVPIKRNFDIDFEVFEVCSRR